MVLSIRNLNLYFLKDNGDNDWVLFDFEKQSFKKVKNQWLIKYLEAFILDNPNQKNIFLGDHEIKFMIKFLIESEQSLKELFKEA